MKHESFEQLNSKKRERNKTHTKKTQNRRRKKKMNNKSMKSFRMMEENENTFDGFQ